MCSTKANLADIEKKSTLVAFRFTKKIEFLAKGEFFFIVFGETGKISNHILKLLNENSRSRLSCQNKNHFIHLEI